MILVTGLTTVKLAAPITEEYAILAAVGEIDENQPDTDYDGLPDYMEINFSIKGADGKPLIEFVNGIVDLPTYGECVDIKSELTYVERGLYRFDNQLVTNADFISYVKHTVIVLPIVSDPTSEDGDGDGYLDSLLNEVYVNRKDNYDGYIDIADPEPLHSNVSFISLKNDYIHISNPTAIPNLDGKSTASYGGIQTNFYDKKTNPSYYDNVGKDIYEKGCGLISISDIIIYLSNSSDLYENISDIKYDFNDDIDFNDYQIFVRKLHNLAYPKYIFGIYRNVFAYKKFLLSYFTQKEVELNVETVFLYVPNAFLLASPDMYEQYKDACFDKIKSSIINDKPVYLGVGKITSTYLYYYANNYYGDNITKKPYQCIDGLKDLDMLNEHAVTITGVILDSLQNKEFLVVSSCGNKYVVDSSELFEGIKIDVSFILIN